jgi:hypothetical protein
MEEKKNRVAAIGDGLTPCLLSVNSKLNDSRSIPDVQCCRSTLGSFSVASDIAIFVQRSYFGDSPDGGTGKPHRFANGTADHGA